MFEIKTSHKDIINAYSTHFNKESSQIGGLCLGINNLLLDAYFAGDSAMKEMDGCLRELAPREKKTNSIKVLAFLEQVELYHNPGDHHDIFSANITQLDSHRVHDIVSSYDKKSQSIADGIFAVNQNELSTLLGEIGLLLEEELAEHNDRRFALSITGAEHAVSFIYTKGGMWRYFDSNQLSVYHIPIEKEPLAFFFFSSNALFDNKEFSIFHMEALGAGITGKVGAKIQALFDDYFRKIDATRATKKNITPLWVACQNGHFDAVKFLVEHKADIHKANKDDITPLWEACFSGQLAVVEFLVKHKADIHKANKDDVTPLLIACAKGYLPVVKFLVEHKADIHKANKDDFTPLWVACQNGQLPVVEFLVEHKADIHKENKDGITPLWIACSIGHLEVVKFLVEQHKADIHKASNDNATPLWAACSKGHLEVVKFLVEQGADINKSFSGFSPIKIAQAYGHQKVVQFLEAIDEQGKSKNYLTQHTIWQKAGEKDRKEAHETENRPVI